ncbi:hypothetical protein L211DRAFT_112762 [Terfezia boudieri ATCC MYA-4762]|uniref:Uncharacterized protein n=1 Tax=Terfezia boudieri ATCC MYA-4762 TaxID=1051890 RepID=A0A3N4LVT7_9PEZI|nr:hypothetical protein L211DRAFT_112762 [Terfezia boudieri ATCC MYA-4762]
MPSPSRQADVSKSHRDPRGGSADEAAKTAMWGGLIGCLKWSIYSALGGLVAYRFSPVFRNLTPQFKVYLFMCPVTIGGMVEADRRLRQYEARIRMERRAEALSQATGIWDDLEELEKLTPEFVGPVEVKEQNTA